MYPAAAESLWSVLIVAAVFSLVTIATMMAVGVAIPVALMMSAIPGLPGFGLRITSTNRKSYFVSYRADGRKRTKTLGTTEKMSRPPGLEAVRARASTRSRSPM